MDVPFCIIWHVVCMCVDVWMCPVCRTWRALCMYVCVCGCVVCGCVDLPCLQNLTSTVCVCVLMCKHVCVLCLHSPNERPAEAAPSTAEGLHLEGTSQLHSDRRDALTQGAAGGSRRAVLSDSTQAKLEMQKNLQVGRGLRGTHGPAGGAGGARNNWTCRWGGGYEE